ncbi:unnamed protein product [Rhizophagus irregularis]|nr:unnamed protein product [Rhizophagus irregularis]
MSEMNEWVKWIDEAIAKKHIKHYEYKYFKHIQEIEDAIKELVHEIELQREVTFHNNVISFHGVTISDQENQSDNIKKYLLVMEYADGGSLSKYLKENFEKLTWEVKLKLAYQLASAVSCLHDEDIIHRDLHSNNIYTECWNDNPDNRPSIQEVVERLDV